MEYTATVGETGFRCTEEQCPIVAAQARESGQKAYLVRNSDNRVIGEA